MGKSPGKWIKTVLGRRSSKSHSSKESKTKAPELVVGSPVISQEVPHTAHSNTNPEPEVSVLPANETSDLPVNQDIRGPEKFTSNETSEPGDDKEEQAATKAQAAFRGHLARKAFHALRGILRLQAVIRGHLVRRQAVATLYCIYGIVRLQAVVRGQRVRLLSEIPRKFHKALILEVKQPGSSNADASYMRRFPARTFIYKLLSSTPARRLVRIQYLKEDPNSIWNWLERWSFSRFWKPVPTSKKLIELKSKLKYRGNMAEDESSRPRLSVRRNFSKNSDSGSTAISSETDRNRHNPRKSSSLPGETVEVNPQSELEKVKRNLRKISSSWAQVSNQVDSETEKPRHGARNTSSSCSVVPKEAVAEFPAEVTVSLENGFKETTTMVEADPKSDQNICFSSSFDATPIESHKVVDSYKHDNFGETLTETPVTLNSVNGIDIVSEIYHLQGIVLDDNHPDLYEGPPKETEANKETQKASKRRSSFSMKTEYPENTSLETPKLPSYMAATESAKAKLRGQSSPRFSLDGSEKNGFVRRHSLPSSTNGKLTSQSPRVQKPIPFDNKGGGSARTARDGNDKPVRAEWKRW